MHHKVKSPHRRFLFSLLTGTLLLAGCSLPSAAVREVPNVDLETREPLPAVGSIEQKSLRVGVGAILSAESTFAAYTDLGEYLGEKLGRPVEIVQRRTYAELNSLIADGHVDIAFVCTGAFVAGSTDGYLDLLVVPEIGGKTSYHSLLIVPAASDAHSPADLRGTRFAFTDPISLTGRVYPTSLVSGLGETPDTFFGSTVFTYSHDRAIRAVAAGVVDGAGVNNLVLADLIERDPSIAARIRVISESPDFANPPVVIPSDTPPAIRARFAELLIQIVAEPGGETILDSLGVDRFVLPNHESYQEVGLLLAEHPMEP